MKGSITSRSKGSWTLRFDLPRDATGKRHQRRVTLHGTKKQAQEEMRRLLRELDTGSFVEPSKQTLGDYLEHWLDAYAKPNVAASTHERYTIIVNRHLTPALGHLLLAKLQPLHIQDYYAQALKDGRADHKGGLSPRTVLHHHRVLKLALKQAVRWRLLHYNPADAVEPPRARRQEFRTLDEDEMWTLLEAIKPMRIYLPSLIAATTGLRRGEVLALRWQDVDFERSLLSVQRTASVTKTGVEIKAPKTARGRRQVPLSGIVLDALKAHRLEQNKRRLALGPAYQNRALIVCREDGLLLDPRGVSKEFKRTLEVLGQPVIRFHDLRHIHASHFLKMGENPKVVSERLGHATVAVTMDVYAHVLPGVQEDAVARYDVVHKAALQRVQKKNK